MSVVMCLFAAVCVLNVLDAWTTKKGLDTGKAVERIVILKWLMNKIGVVPALVLIKAIFLGLLYLWGMNVVFLTITGILYVVVVVNNFKVLSTIRANR